VWKLLNCKYFVIAVQFGCCLQGRQSVVKIGGGQTRRGSGEWESPSGVLGQSPWWGSGAKPLEAKGYYGIKLEF